MNFSLSDQRGSSYITVLLVSSSVLLAAVAIQQSLFNQKKAATSASSNAAIDTLHGMVYSTIQDQKNCWATIKPVLPGGTLTETGTIRVLPLNKIMDSNQTTALVEVLPDGEFDPNRVYVNQNVRVRNMTLVLPADLKDPAQIEVEYARFDAEARTKRGYGGKNIKKTISLVLQRNPIGNKSTCYAVTEGDNGNESLMEEFCIDMGGGNSLFVWDDENQACRLKKQECSGQVFVGLKADGTANCQNLEDWADLSTIIDTTASEPFDPATASSVRFEFSAGGKMKVVTTPSGGDSPPPPLECTPVPECPPAWGSHLSLTSNSLTNDWPNGASEVETRIAFDSGQTCRVELRKNTTCLTGPSIRRKCDYNNSLKTGCDAEASASCTPVPTCPPSWKPEVVLRENNISTDRWTEHLGGIFSPASTVEVISSGGSQWVGDGCKSYHRKANTCNGVGEFHICAYSDDTNRGCEGFPLISSAGICTPPECRAAWDPSLAFLKEHIETVPWPWGATELEYYDPAVDKMHCRLSLRKGTECSGLSQWKICNYTNSEAKGCVGLSEAPACTPVNNCPAAWRAGISEAPAWGLDYTSILWPGAEGTTIHPAEIKADSCILLIRNDPSCTTEKNTCYYHDSENLSCAGYPK